MPGLERNNLVWAQTIQNRQYFFQLKGEIFGEHPMTCVTHAGFHHWRAVKGLIPQWAEAEGNALSSTSAVCYLLQWEPRAAPCVETVSCSTFPQGFHFPSTFEDSGRVAIRMGQCRGTLNGDVSDWLSLSSRGYYSGQIDLLGFSSCGDI